MSRVTDVLLTTSCMEVEEDDSPKAGIAAVNSWLEDTHRCFLVPTRDHAGGNKVMQAEVWLCAVNHLDESGLISAVRKAPWVDPDHVRLLVNREDGNGFEVVVSGLPRSISEGCRSRLALGQFWSFCGETDMGQSVPALCTACGGEFKRA